MNVIDLISVVGMFITVFMAGYTFGKDKHTKK